MSDEPITPENAIDLTPGDELLVDGEKRTFMQFNTIKVIDVTDDKSDEYEHIDLTKSGVVVTRATSGGADSDDSDDEECESDDEECESDSEEEIPVQKTRVQRRVPVQQPKSDIVKSPENTYKPIEYKNFFI